MSKWDYLIEADKDWREIERAYRANPNEENTVIRYANALIKKAPSRTGARFDRLVKEFKSNPSMETAGEVINDYDRITSKPRDKELHRTCELEGKMGRVCRQANQQEITTKHFVILVSYQTPVAYVVRKTGDEFHTKTRHSRITNKHIRIWTSNRSEPVEQAELNDIYSDI